MSNTRKLRPSLTAAGPTLYSCAVCELKFHSWLDREGHWKYGKGARLCVDAETMLARGYRYTRGAWTSATKRPRSQPRS